MESLENTDKAPNYYGYPLTPERRKDLKKVAELTGKTQAKAIDYALRSWIRLSERVRDISPSVAVAILVDDKAAPKCREDVYKRLFFAAHKDADYKAF